MNDISKLCAHAQVDETSYRVFPSRGAVARTGDSPGVVPLTSNAALPTHQVATPVQDSRQRVPFAVWQPPVTEQESQPACTVVMRGAVGGVGTSTIISTTARALASSGRAVLLVDGSASPLASLHWGGAGAFRGPQTFVSFGPAGRGMVHLLTPDLPEKGQDELADLAFHKAFASRQSEVSEVLIDASRPMSRAAAEILIPSHAASVVVIVPDLASILKVKEAEALPAANPIYYLLNKFDPEVTCHREVREWLLRQLGPRLLPFSIERSDLVTEALLAGQTVADYAPDSAVFNGLLRFAEWVKGQQRSSDLLGSRITAKLRA